MPPTCELPRDIAGLRRKYLLTSDADLNRKIGLAVDAGRLDRMFGPAPRHTVEQAPAADPRQEFERWDGLN